YTQKGSQPSTIEKQSKSTLFLTKQNKGKKRKKKRTGHLSNNTVDHLIIPLYSFFAPSTTHFPSYRTSTLPTRTPLSPFNPLLSTVFCNLISYTTFPLNTVISSV